MPLTKEQAYAIVRTTTEGDERVAMLALLGDTPHLWTELQEDKLVPVLRRHLARGTRSVKEQMLEALAEWSQQSSSTKTAGFGSMDSTLQETIESIYADLRIDTENGNVIDPIPDVHPDCGAFDMSLYPNEDLAIPDFLQHIENGLKLNGVPMRQQPGFWLYDLHKLLNLLVIQHRGSFYKAGMDGGIVPFGAAEDKRELRAGITIKHSELHKARYKQANLKIPRTGNESHVEVSSIWGQVFLDVLAAAVHAEYPGFIHLVSSYDTNAVLQLKDGVLRRWQDLTFNAAVFKLATLLKSCSTDLHYSLEAHRAELPVTTLALADNLRTRLRPVSTLSEQLESLRGMTDDPAEQLKDAWELIEAHCRPWLELMHA